MHTVVRPVCEEASRPYSYITPWRKDLFLIDPWVHVRIHTWM